MKRVTSKSISILMMAVALSALLVCNSAFAQTKQSAILKEYARFYHAVNYHWDPNGPNVVEFFSYNCTYCFQAEKFVSYFKKHKPDDVRFQAYKITFDNISWQLSQYAFAAAYLAGVEDKVHDGLFHRFNVEGKPFGTKEDVRNYFQSVGLLQKVQPYLDSKESKDFRMHIYHMAVDDEVVRTPTFIVNGKYAVAWGTDQSPEKFSELVTALAQLSAPGSRESPKAP